VTRHRLIVGTVAVVAMLACGIAYPQQAPPSQQPAAAKEPVLLKVQVMISRRQGEKVISRHPYTLNVDADGGRSNLKMGTQIPVVSVNLGDGKTTYNYRDVGTVIDCGAKTLEGGRYKLDITLTDNQVLADDTNGTAKGPQFGSFSLGNEIAVLRDGQTSQLTTATEKATGTVITVDVTLNVIK
jgi:hypothetical protein